MDSSRDLTMQVKMNGKCFPDIERLARGEAADETQILAILDFIDARYDCADFRLVCVLRSLYAYADLISAPTLAAMKASVLGFKYWMDEPGEDSMCFWSENHQLLFAACEYLAGQLYPDEVFTNDGKSGAAHREHAKAALDRWLGRRWRFGFIEWHSNTYYEEDVAPLSLLVDFCADSGLARKAVILLDLLMLDLALHSFEGFFCATSGRCYEAQKKEPRSQDVGDIIAKAFGLDRALGAAGPDGPAGPDGRAGYDYSRLSAEFVLNRGYRLPEVIRAIALQKGDLEIKASMGLDLAEIGAQFPDRKDRADRGMFLWAMEAFTNAESVELTLDIFRSWGLKTNDFLRDLAVLDRPLVRAFHLLPLAVRALNPATQGIAIQRANTYTWKTPRYMLSTAQAYHPGEFGDQQHIWQATLEGGLSVFTTHPGGAFFEDNARNFSPDAWVGNGINPHSVQHRNLGLSLYDLRVRRGFMESPRLLFTHAFFPFARFDEVIEAGERLWLGKRGGAYIALFSLRPMVRRGEDELVQEGRVTAWAVMLGDSEREGSFEDFARAARAASLRLVGAFLRFEAGSLLELRFGGAFSVDGAVVDTEYPRLETAFVRLPRYADAMDLGFGGSRLRLDFGAGRRECV